MEEGVMRSEVNIPKRGDDEDELQVRELKTKFILIKLITMCSNSFKFKFGLSLTI